MKTVTWEGGLNARNDCYICSSNLRDQDYVLVRCRDMLGGGGLSFSPHTFLYLQKVVETNDIVSVALQFNVDGAYCVCR